MNWRQPKSRTPLARLGDKCIATRGNKWIGDSRRPGHHQPSWIETGRKPDATSQTGRQMNCHKREANNLDIAKAGHHQPHGDRDAQRAEHHQPDWETNGLPQGETHELETAKAGHHQPDWETNESVFGETNELETAERPDTTSQIGKQMSCHKGRQMNWRQPKSRTPLARLGDKCIATRGNKWIGDSRRPGHHQPSWIETGRKPDATSQTGRQMNCHKREANNLDIAKAGHHQPHGIETRREPNTTSQTGRQMDCHKGRHMNWRQPKPDTTSQTGRQTNRYMGRQMNWRQPKGRTPPARLGNKWVATRRQMTWRQPESRTPPARLGDKSIATREDKWIGDSRQHRKPDTTSQTGRQMNCHKPETNELETAREPDTTSQTGRQVKCHEGGQMNWSQPKSWTPPARLGNKWIVGKTQTPPARLGDKWIRDSQRAGHHQRDWDSRRAGHHQPDWETNELPQGKTNELETAKAGHHQPDWETNELPQGETNELETAEEPDTTSQTGKQMSWYKGKQMNWRQPESWTPPARLGDKWIATRGQMNSGHPESQTPPSEHSRTPLERELRTPTVNCLGTDGRHRAQGGGHSPWHKADTS